MASEAVEASRAGTRIAWLDKLRGFAIAGMMLSHFTRFLALPGWEWVLIATRPFMPFFAVLIGVLWRPGFRKRHVQLAAAAAVTVVLAAQSGFAVPSILGVLLIALPIVQLVHKAPVAGIIGGLVQVMSFPIPYPWTGYQPGLVVALILVGYLARHSGGLWEGAEARALDRLPGAFAAIGRRPLTWYAGHLLVLAAILTVQGQGAIW